jgi:hypothetical protein
MVSVCVLYVSQNEQKLFTYLHGIIWLVFVIGTPYVFCGIETELCIIVFRPTLRPTQPPIQWVPEFKAAGA